jgi:uncharacterized LabA/DUF88 family protein
MKTVAMHVDIANLYYCIERKWAGRRLDYTTYKDRLVGEDVLYKAIAYGLQYENNDFTSFATFLKHLGFTPKYKRPRAFKDPKSGQSVDRRTSWAMGMAMDIVDAVTSNKVDEVIIGSSEGDLAPLVRWVQDRGVKVRIVSCGISRDLVRVCPNCTELTEEFLHVSSASA